MSKNSSVVVGGALVATTCIALTAAFAAPYFPSNRAFHTNKKKKSKDYVSRNQDERQNETEKLPPPANPDPQEDAITSSQDNSDSPQDGTTVIDETSFQQDCLSVSRMLRVVGSVHFIKCNFDKAGEAYGEAHHLLTMIAGENNLDVATVNILVGNVYLARQDTDTAIAKYREALSVLCSELDQHDPTVTNLLQKIALVEMNLLDEAHMLVLAMLRNSDECDSEVESDTLVLDRLVSKAKNDRVETESIKQTWSYLEDQDQKVASLMEKIALVDSSELEKDQQLRFSSSQTSMDGIVPEDDEDVDNRTINSLDQLRDELKEDMEHVDLVLRQFEIDMVKEKLHMRREPAFLEGGFRSNEGTPAPRQRPGSKGNRTDGLVTIKERLERLRKTRYSRSQ